MMDLSDDFEASSEYSYGTNTASVNGTDVNDDGVDMVDDSYDHDG